MCKGRIGKMLSGDDLFDILWQEAPIYMLCVWFSHVTENHPNNTKMD